MGFDFSYFEQVHSQSETSGVGRSSRPDEDYIDWLVHEHSMFLNMQYEKLWNYYRNEMQELGYIDSNDTDENEFSRPYRQDQEYGLPSRITGMNYNFYGGVLGGRKARGIQRKEIVIENDIRWRIDTMVDFLFGKGIHISSKAGDPERAKAIEAILSSVLDHSGGIPFLQEIALLGSIYGFVDIVLRWDDFYDGGQGGTKHTSSSISKGFAEGQASNPLHDVIEQAKHISLETIEAPRSLPVLNENNYRNIDFYVQHYWQEHPVLDGRDDVIQRVNHRGRNTRGPRETHNIEIIGPYCWQRYEDKNLVASGLNPLGIIPVVHIQNMALPHQYEGQSDVGPLISLQDELNTRLSDRANRITFQSFKMYLGKGIEGFEDRAISPGRMWSTENPEASIEEFGGDKGSPSEESHILHIREAMDKASGVASVAAGILKGRIGNLTSAVALKVTLMGVLSKNERKRKNYGKGIADLCRLILAALDRMGIYATRPDEREIEIHWPSPLPENLMEKLQEASIKKELGVPKDQILNELGYSVLR